jgi:hypothetical protein
MVNVKYKAIMLSLASIFYPTDVDSRVINVFENTKPDVLIEKSIDKNLFDCNYKIDESKFINLDDFLINRYDFRKEYELSTINKELLSLDEKLARIKIKDFIDSKYGVYVFGNYLDNLVKKREIPLKINENFLVDEMDLFIVVKRSELNIMIFQNYNDEEILLLKKPVALGGVNFDYFIEENRNFQTPLGDFYIKRIVNMPIWYPPSWSKLKSPPKPGINNPYGLWMMELTRANNTQLNYNYSLEGDSGYRIHSTNNPQSIGTYASYGCVRLHPDVADELFNALFRYKKCMPPKETMRGIVHPLYDTIPVKIIP